MDDELRNSLWSLLTLFYWNTYEAPGSGMYGGRSDHVKRSNLHPLRISLIPDTCFTAMPDGVSRDAGQRFTLIADSSRTRERPRR